MLTLLALGLCACRKPAPFLKLEGRTMGTTYHITAARPPADLSPKKLQEEVDALLADINKKMSTYDPESELSRFNAYRGSAPFPVSPETALVVRAALEFAEASRGAFDPTVGPLVDLWGFGPKDRPPEPPQRGDIRRLLKSTGHRHVKVRGSPPALSKDLPEVRLDLSAIAKGYGVDAAAGLLRKRGLSDFLVEIGGEIVASGRNPDGRPWRLGVDTPKADAEPGKDFSAYVRLENGALATSGDYRNYFVKDGVRYSHFIDPRTGAPVFHKLASASVLAPTCMEADAAATAVMVLGPEAGIRFVESKKGREALLLVADERGGFTAVATANFPRETPPGNAAAPD